MHLATHTSGILVAVKKIDKTSLKHRKIRETLAREIIIHKQLKHQYIVRLYSAIEDADFIYLIMEYINKGNLFTSIRQARSFNEDEAFYYFVQAASGIYFLHEHGFIHRDLKPENLLISEINLLKICDFGWVTELKENAESEHRNTFCGTLEYMAPEMIGNMPHNHLIDVWSLGILLYEMCHGKAPFRGS